jgi:hypothetical protein
VDSLGGTGCSYLSIPKTELTKYEALTVKEKKAATVIGQGHATAWNTNEGYGAVEELWWREMSAKQKNALRDLGWNKPMWDEEPTHGPCITGSLCVPADYYTLWEDIAADRQVLYSALGFTSATWDASDLRGVLTSLHAGLSGVKKQALADLCFSAAAWDAHIKLGWQTEYHKSLGSD